jgi:hypothetical protein
MPADEYHQIPVKRDYLPDRDHGIMAPACRGHRRLESGTVHERIILTLS